MKKIEVAIGTKYGNLTVVFEVQPSKRREFLCRCDCGQSTQVRLDHLRSGHTSSCGKCGIEYMGKRKTISAWAESVGMPESTLRARLKIMSLGEALRRGK